MELSRPRSRGYTREVVHRKHPRCSFPAAVRSLRRKRVFFLLCPRGGVCRPNNKHGNQCKPTPAQPEPSHGPAVNPHAQTTTLSDPVRRHDEQPIPHGNAVGDYVQEWYSAFVGGLGDELLFETLLAANYLDLPPLLEICAATIGLRMMSELLRPAPLPVRLGTMDRSRVWSCFWLACLLFEW